MTAAEFRHIAQRLHPWLMDVAGRYHLDHDTADDVVQETLIRLWQMQHTLHEPVEPLAKVILRNIIVDTLRRQKHTLPLNENITAHSSTDTAGSTDRVERMLKVMTTLPENQQDILRLRHLEGMEMKQLAQHTGSNETTVRQQLSRARKALKAAYLKYSQHDEH